MSAKVTRVIGLKYSGNITPRPALVLNQMQRMASMMIGFFA
jgi:predicted ATP-grasp superfamily ATP-dependent carboligase